MGKRKKIKGGMYRASSHTLGGSSQKKIICGRSGLDITTDPLKTGYEASR